MQSLQDKIQSLPKHPGCYLFYNKMNNIIYIGKSKSLKNRVRQYFQNTAEKEGKYKRLSQEIADVKIILTPTERDALILECQLIKTHKPWYNAQLKRSKVHPYILIDTKKDFPTISIETKYIEGKQSYFGFFYNEEDAFDTIELLNSIWQTPTCCKQKFPAAHRPCLNYHLNKCCAPCIANPDKEVYKQKINEIINCLNQKSTPLKKKMQKNMQNAVQELNYEKATYYRDIINELDRLQIKSRRFFHASLKNKDVLLFFRAYHEHGYSLFFIQDQRTRLRMDFNPDFPMQDTEIKAFADKIYKKDFGEEKREEEQFLTVCLMDIFADKYFILLPKRKNPDMIFQRIKEGMMEYGNI